MVIGLGTASAAPRQELTLERVVQRPAPGMAVPRRVTFAPGGETITFLQADEGSLVQNLWSLDIASGARVKLLGEGGVGGGAREGELSREEELRRERMRELATGVTDYRWAANAARMVIPARGDLYVLEGGALTRISETPKPELDPRLSADGRHVAYVREGQLLVRDLPSVGEMAGAGAGRERALSERASDRTYGLPDFIAAEEFHRMEGFWWSPDAAWIAYAEVDESPVTSFPIVHSGGKAHGAPDMETHRYPFAGEANALVRVGIVPVAGGETRWLEVEGLAEGYLARVRWRPDSKAVWVEVLTRSQQELVAWEAPLDASLPLKKLHADTSELWVPVTDNFRFVKSSEGVYTGYVRTSWSSGSTRVALHDMGGVFQRFLSPEGGHVDRITGFHAPSQTLYFTGWRTDPRQQNLYAVSLAGGDPDPALREGGTSSAVFDGAGERFIHRFSSLETAPSVVVRSRTGEALATLQAPEMKEARSLGLRAPLAVELKTEGDVLLHGHVYLPPNYDRQSSRKWPAVSAIYGGPGYQLVRDRWRSTVRLRPQFLASQGFVVFTVDNRGTGRRGPAFEGAHHRRLGTLEVVDQVRGAEYLVDEWNVDPKRLAIMGWSYGGYLSAMTMARAPGVFQAAVIGAPVIDWRGYDTGYTERFMGTPEDNPEGYTDGDVTTHVEGVRGDLLILHGMIDENVHFRHTAVFIEALSRAGKPHRLMVFPEARHSPRDPAAKLFAEGEVIRFLVESLGSRSAP